jgi:hypothetical protein
MNKVFVSLLAILFSYTVFAQNKSNLTISTTGSSNLKIKLGNNRYTFQDRTATFQGLNPGNYDLIIYQWQKGPDGRFNYIQVYNNTIKLTASRHTEISILRFGKMAWDEGPIIMDEWDDSYKNPDPEAQGDHYNYSQQPMSDEQFATIKKTINGEFGDENMLRMAKLALKNNYFTTKQIRDIAKLFFTDDTKLSFTKIAYDHVVDKGNYITIADLFFSSEHKQSLLEHIGNQ